MNNNNKLLWSVGCLYLVLQNPFLPNLTLTPGDDIAHVENLWFRECYRLSDCYEFCCNIHHTNYGVQLNPINFISGALARMVFFPWRSNCPRYSVIPFQGVLYPRVGEYQFNIVSIFIQECRAINNISLLIKLTGNRQLD